MIYADDCESKRIQDIWEFKDPQHPLYPTQKNLEFSASFIPSLFAEVEHFRIRTLADVLTHLFDLVPNDCRPLELQTLRR